MPSLRQISTSRSAQETKAPMRADGDDLPEPAFLQRRQRQAVVEIGRRDADLPEVPGRAQRGAIDDQRHAEEGEEDRRDAEEADVERPDPEVEQDRRRSSVPPRTRYFRSKLSMAMFGSSGPGRFGRPPALPPGGGRGRVMPGPRPLPSSRDAGPASPWPAGSGDICSTAPVCAARGPSSQLNRSVLSRMK